MFAYVTSSAKPLGLDRQPVEGNGACARDV